MIIEEEEVMIVDDSDRCANCDHIKDDHTEKYGCGWIMKEEFLSCPCKKYKEADK